MSVTNTATRYGTVTKTFHWLIALFMITTIALGLIAHDLPYETDAQLALKALLFSMHKTLGVLIFATALARIVWALTQTKPGPLHPERKLETQLAALVHWLLYISLVAVPLTGWIHHAASTGFAPIWLPIGQNLPFVPKDEALSSFFSVLHDIFSKVLIVSLLLHVAGALKHHVIDKDSTLRRMWFGNADAPAVPAHGRHVAAPVAAIAIYLAATGVGAAVGLSAAPQDAPAATLDQVASDWTVQDGAINLTVVQLGSPVQGNFADWTAAITFDAEATGTVGGVTTTVSIGSLTLGSVTGQAKGADFFDAATFPTATFAADIETAETGYVANGTLTIKDNTVPVSLPFTLTLDGDTATMSGTVTLDRRDFGIGASMQDESNLNFGVTVDVAVTATRGGSDG